MSSKNLGILSFYYIKSRRNGGNSMLFLGEFVHVELLCSKGQMFLLPLKHKMFFVTFSNHDG